MATTDLVLTVDRHHAVGCAATVRSVVEHAPAGAVLRFHVATVDLDPAEAGRLAAGLDRGPASVALRVVAFPVDRVRHLTRSRLVTHTAYLRLFLDEIAPPDAARCIYLDSDLLVGRDVTELAAFPLEGRTVGAVENLSAEEQREHQARLGLAAPHYFNSGVLLVDLARWRERGVGARALDAAARIGDRLILHDQDALNLALEGDWTPLPPHWNHAAASAVRAEGTVLHFMGAPKPWDLDYAGPFADEFAVVRARTAYAGRRTWNPAGLGRLLQSARRRLPYLPGALRMLRLALRRGKA